MPRPSQNDSFDPDSRLIDRFFWKCQSLILARPRSEKEILIYLDRKLRIQKAIDERKLKEAILKELKNQNLINDEAFIRWWVEGRNYFKPRGRTLLKLELINKGVDKDLVESVLPEFLEDEDKQAEKALVKKIKALEKLDKKAKFKKTIDYLMRKGFSYRTSKKTFDNFFSKE